MNNLKIDAKMQQNMLQAMQLIENDDDNIETKRAILSTAKKCRCANAEIDGHPLSTLYLENDAIQDLVENHLLPDLKKWQQDGKNAVLLACSVI